MKKRILSLLLVLVTVLSLAAPAYAVGEPEEKATPVAAAQLATPKITSVTANGKAVTVKWGKVEGAAAYRLFYMKNGKWTNLQDTTGTSVTRNGSYGKTYTYTVRCITADGKSYTSSYDPTGKSITLINNQLATPKITSVTASGRAVTVKWGAVEGAEAYRLFFMKNGKWTRLQDTTETSVTKNGTYGKTYTYTVRCISADGKSYTSSYDASGKSITLTNSQLPTPQITSVTASGKAVTVKWSAVEGAAKYRLFFMKNGKWTKLQDTTDTSVTKNGAYGKTYTYTVRCISADGSKYTSSYDAKGKSITLTNSQLATPKITDVSVASSGWSGYATIKWGAVQGAVKYRVFYKTGNESWTKLGDTSDTEFVCYGMASGTSYRFTVRCISEDGKTYLSDYDRNGKAAMFVETPYIYSAEDMGGGFLLSWRAVTGAAKYRVFYKTASTGWKKIGDTATASFYWAEAKTGTKYAFTVRALDSSGEYVSDYYDMEASYVCSAVDKRLTPPAIEEEHIHSKYIQIACEDVDDGSGYGYELLIARDAACSSVVARLSDDSSRVLVYRANIGGIYYYRVRIYRTQGDTRVYGPWSEAHKLSIMDFHNKLNSAAKYSYELYFVDNLGTALYSEVPRAIYIKTDNPDGSSIDFKVNGASAFTSAYMQSNFYDDVEYLSGYLTGTLRKVDGGYLCMGIKDAPGTYTVDLLEASLEGYVVAKSFPLKVLDYEAELYKWIDGIIAASTTDKMNPKEKMDAVLKHLWTLNFRYPHNANGVALSLAAEPDGPFFKTMRWDSYVSPAALAQIAERIGGFDEVHNCYGDYTYGTFEWQLWHYTTYVIYKGERYDYQCCPAASTGDVGEIQMIDFSNTSKFTKIG